MPKLLIFKDIWIFVIYATKKEQKKILEITEKYKNDLIKQWETFMRGEKINIIKIK